MLGFYRVILREQTSVGTLLNAPGGLPRTDQDLLDIAIYTTLPPHPINSHSDPAGT